MTTASPALAAGCPGEQNANSRVGDNQGMQLLSDGRSPICKIYVELPEVLLQEGDRHVLGAKVGKG